MIERQQDRPWQESKDFISLCVQGTFRLPPCGENIFKVPQWDNDWAKGTVSAPDTACHWYVVNPDNTSSKGFGWITAPKYDFEALQDIAAQHEVTVDNGNQTTVELMNASADLKYGDDC
ncbi:hypothetical protein [Synechococcus sp. BA-132 BA5]|uniref:hypothetical protein n=1 Tax=Synechococcus sp. BA-132 BA5 TaxID=3110252 RepID=UPI002B21E05F|nr:hypothetical protein [Synechococcus sp. BA-132 BA5]MEA5414385.1 hypothetical protein [Synechococcus sp. BA-132 BA5]